MSRGTFIYEEMNNGGGALRTSSAAPHRERRERERRERERERYILGSIDMIT